MPPTQKDLLAAAHKHDVERDAHLVKLNKAIIGVGAVEAAPVPAPLAVVPIDPDDDPFNGNQNNRRVAERVTHAALHRQNQPQPVVDPIDPLTHTVNAIKQSKRVNPDPVIDKDYDEPVRVAPPTPGSPAALAAAKEAKEAKPFSDVNKAGEVAAGTAPQGSVPAAPPTWKPNA
jgi:hypothetical protein